MKQGTITLRGVQPVSGACGLLAGLVVARGEATISFDNFQAILFHPQRPLSPPAAYQPALFMRVRDENAETPSETGAWSPECLRRT